MSSENFLASKGQVASELIEFDRFTDLSKQSSPSYHSPVIPFQPLPRVDNNVAEQVQPEWLLLAWRCCNCWRAQCSKDEKVANKRLIVPQSNATQIVASATFDHYQLDPNCRRTPFCLTTSDWTLSINRESKVLSGCSEAELGAFVDKANATFREKREKLDVFPSKAMKCRIIVMLLFLVLYGALAGVLAGVVYWSLVFSFISPSIISYFILRCIYYARVRSAAKKFSEEVRKWVGEHQGPFYEKGVIPKVGYYGTFISFEANLV
jgi:hypothetical protein